MRHEIVISFIILYLSPKVKMKPLSVDDTKDNFFWRNNDGGRCEPFESYIVDCNRCICNADGVPYCTKVACIDMMYVVQLKKRRRARTTTMSTINYDINDNQMQHY